MAKSYAKSYAKSDIIDVPLPDWEKSMVRWNAKIHANIENEKIDAFLIEVLAVCKKHGFSLGHEDGHGAFEIHAYDDSYANWLSEAHDHTPAT